MIDFSKIDYSKYKEIKKQLNIPKEMPNDMNSLSWTVFKQPETKVYLLYEFELEGCKLAYVVVHRWDRLSKTWDYIDAIWGKELMFRKYKKSKNFKINRHINKHIYKIISYYKREN
ncbi:MAG: hypothetical protein PHT02_00510 [Tissierellia bacterium]|nr:hypothetical protein [Tissierellia bacterium]